ncbi:MAG: hypothetical protein ABW137_18270 [Mycobacterium sp.]
MEERIEQLPQDDWVDQDLLTKDLAGSKLDAEIAGQRQRIADYDAGAATTADIYTREQMEQRLAAMIQARESLRGHD